MIKHTDTDTCECGREKSAFQFQCHLCLRVEEALQMVDEYLQKFGHIVRAALSPRKLDG